MIIEAVIIKRVANKWSRARRRARPAPLTPEAILNLRVEAYAQVEAERHTAEEHEEHERHKRLSEIGRAGGEARRAS
jgi:hypothetical protein